LFEEVGSVNVPPLQIGEIWVNVGVVAGPTVTVIVVIVAHCPAFGINVYVVVVVVLIAGFQIPVIPFVDVEGKLKEFPEQIGPTCVNVGTVCGFIVTVIVVTVAHWPLPGVNV
jgi:hypothetical protein